MSVRNRARAQARRVRESLRSAPWWVSSPARRIKDLDSSNSLPATAVALTYDDGPHPEITPRMLELLAEYSVTATFFMCGLAAQRHPDIVREVAAAGHTIGGHTWDHLLIPALSDSEWTEQIDRTHELLGSLSGTAIRWFRPPQGRGTRTTRVKLRETGLWSVRWSAAGRDWSLRDPVEIADAALADLGPSGIVLFHDAIADYTLANPPQDQPNQEPTIAASRIVIESILERGLTPIGLDELPSSRMPSVSVPRLLT